MEKEKMLNIYEAMADMTLEMINKERKGALYLDGDELEMVRTTQSLYETINYANRAVVTTESVRDVSNNLENDCKYTDRPDVM